MSALRTIGINVLVALALFAMLEIGYRTVKFAGSCAEGRCRGEFRELGNKFVSPIGRGLSQPDPVLGYVPRDGDYVVESEFAGPYTVTIRDNVRQHSAAAPAADDIVTLVVGDSFAFGDEVSDQDTWPACLEQRWNAPVINAAVFGYGAAQAVLRASEFLKAKPADRVIWAILVRHDFERDGLASRSNTPRPAVINDKGVVRFSTIAESNRIHGDVANQTIAKYAHTFGYFYVTKVFWTHLQKFLAPPGSKFDGRWDVVHPSAAAPPAIMRFAFDRFAALDAEKLIVLQHAAKSLRTPRPEELDEVRTIRDLAEARGLTVVDTRPALLNAGEGVALYGVHHTPDGNRIVCEAVAASVSSQGQHLAARAR